MWQLWQWQAPLQQEFSAAPPTLRPTLQVFMTALQSSVLSCCVAGTVFGLCQTVGAAGLLAANYAVSEGLHGSVSLSRLVPDINKTSFLSLPAGGGWFLGHPLPSCSSRQFFLWFGAVAPFRIGTSRKRNLPLSWSLWRNHPGWILSWSSQINVFIAKIQVGNNLLRHQPAERHQLMSRIHQMQKPLSSLWPSTMWGNPINLEEKTNGRSWRGSRFQLLMHTL